MTCTSPDWYLLAALCQQRLRDAPRVVIAVCGRAGSGKSATGKRLRKWGLPGISPPDMAVIDDDVLSVDLIFGQVRRKVRDKRPKNLPPDDLAGFARWLAGKRVVIYVSAYPERRLSECDVLIALHCSDTERRRRLQLREANNGEGRFQASLTQSLDPPLRHDHRLDWSTDGTPLLRADIRSQREKLRVLLIDSGNEWGGGTNSMLELLQRIDRNRFSFRALFYREYPRGSQGTIRDALAEVDIPLAVAPLPRQPWWAKLAKECVRVTARRGSVAREERIHAVERLWRLRPQAATLARWLSGYDLVYLNNQPASNLDGAWAARAAGVPVVQHCRIEPLLTPKIVAAATRSIDRIICVSDGVRTALVSRGVPANHCVVVHNGIDIHASLPDPASVQRIRASLPWQSTTVVFAVVGQLTARKRVADVVAALAQLLTVRPDCGLLIAGDGPDRAALERGVAARKLTGRVAFIGFVSPALPYIAAADVLVLASEKEGLPRVVLEAMVVGKPVIASKVTGNSELVIDGDTGRLFSCRDVTALTKAMQEVVADAELRRRWGEAGLRRVRQHFSIERYVAGTSAVLADIICAAAQQSAA